MEEMETTPSRPVNPRRRRRSQMDIFKESYLPVLIVGFTLIFIIVTIIGSAVQGSKRRKMASQKSPEPSISVSQNSQDKSKEAELLIQEADALAAGYYYDEAIAKIQSFSGKISDYPDLMAAFQQYCDTKANLTAWNDPSKILNLSFQMLIVDPIRAFSDETYSDSYNKNFITVDEFRIILDQLYGNGYVLVNTSQMVTQSADGTFYENTIYLPEGKKPLVITQNQVNYYQYMIDSDGDHLADKGGAGFASKLIIDDNGNIKNEYVDKNGNTLIGDYDLVPILNSYLETHPDFSYQGAKAIISVSGEDGIFGYRTNPNDQQWLGTDYTTEVENAKRISQALRNEGFELACYTYSNISYGRYDLATIQKDLNSWKKEVTPILGDVSILVFAQENDLTPNTPYSGEIFQALMDAGFRYYFGFCQDGKLWADVEETYFRQARIMVKGYSLKYKASWFDGILKPVEILSSTRGTIPQ